MPINKELHRKDIPFLVPDLPNCEQIMPFLQDIDRNRWYSNFGPIQHRFEQRLNQIFFPHIQDAEERVVACSSGTTAIELALLALDLPKNARVLLPSFTFAATATAVIRAGYCPVFTDVDPESWLLTTEIATQVLNYLTVDAVIPVASLGMPQNIQKWDAFSRDRGIPVVIDAAPALGEQSVGNRSIVCFSMHATKWFGIGEGGLVVTPQAEQAKRIRRLSNFGFENGEVLTAGSNYKLSEYHAAIGMAQIERINRLKIRRERVRACYEKHIPSLEQFFSSQQRDFDEWQGEPGVVSLKQPKFNAALALKMKDPNSEEILPKVIDKLQSEGVGVRRWYSPVLHLHRAFKDYVTINPIGQSQLPVTSALNSSLVGLPFHNFLKETEIDFVCERLLQTLMQLQRRKSRQKKSHIKSLR